MDIIKDITSKANVPLSEMTTFRLGGPCKALLDCQTPEDLQRAVHYCIRNRSKFILIGGGSNLVASDHGVDCHVIRYLSETPLVERNGTELTVAASTVLDDLALYAAENGLDGLNCTTGIPGTVGGAIVGNAGAFGKQIGDVVKYISVLDKQGAFKDIEHEVLQFTYRNSILKQTGEIVVAATLTLSQGQSDMLLKEREGILQTRKAKHPNLLKDPCAGSFFRNIEPTSSAGKRQAAGWFLDQAGGKSLAVGGAKIFGKHANIIIKGEGCRAQDVHDLSVKMHDLVKNHFDLDLVREVRFVGDFDGKPGQAKDVIW